LLPVTLLICKLTVGLTGLAFGENVRLNTELSVASNSQ